MPVGNGPCGKSGYGICQNRQNAAACGLANRFCQQVTNARVEPDFVIYKDGIVVIVEVDGDLYHTEIPADAHARLKFLTDEAADHRG
jgi:hypothetical protein